MDSSFYVLPQVVQLYASRCVRVKNMTFMRLLLLFVQLLVAIECCGGFRSLRAPVQRRSTLAKDNKNENTAYSKLLFNVAEVFGNLLSKPSSTSTTSSSRPSSLSVAAVAESIKTDYERIFW